MDLIYQEFEGTIEWPRNDERWSSLSGIVALVG